MIVLLLAVVVGVTSAGPSTENYKDQFHRERRSAETPGIPTEYRKEPEPIEKRVCTDPRTMKKHAAYTEWADAYSCTRHRCQPGGRNLAIYTVGCKRVEAPESAIECEEVVEDTNMQFPYCCTRLRCLVVVRGEVWTRVLGQPWETLPAAPWSHMYKMKKPPPGDNAFLPKTPGEGPIYELASDGENNDKVLRSGKKVPPEADCNNVDAPPRSVPTPDIVIALSTTNDMKEHKKTEALRERHKRNRKQQAPSPYFDDEAPDHRNEIEIDDPPPVETEKPLDAVSEEKYYMNSYGVTQKPFKGQPHHQVAWTEIPPSQWNEHDSPMMDSETSARDGNHPPDFNQLATEEKKDEKPSNLQALVDAIGTRMRDIENVVQRMSEKVHQAKPGQPDYASDEKRDQPQVQGLIMPPRKHHKEQKEHKKEKLPSPDEEHYKRFSVRNRGSKYLRTSDATTEPPLFVEDTSMNGYFSDASNSLVRRTNIAKATPQEPAASTYMAPVETRRKSHMAVSEASEETEKKHKKHSHKKKKGKGRSKKKHRKEEKKKQRVNKINSIEMERNAVSLEDSSALNSK